MRSVALYLTAAASQDLHFLRHHHTPSKEKEEDGRKNGKTLSAAHTHWKLRQSRSEAKKILVAD